MELAYIGFGANLGNPLQTFYSLLKLFSEGQLGEKLALQGISSLYRSEPVGGPEQPAFLNAVFSLSSELPPTALLSLLLSLEAKFGRIRGERWGPRTIDLDLLLYGEYRGEWSGPPELVLPHPRLKSRRFVLLPLLELEPQLRDPESSIPLRQFLVQLSEEGQAVELFLPRSQIMAQLNLCFSTSNIE